MSSQISLTAEELEDMLDRAAKKGANQALCALGLHDDNAAKDINEIRDLLETWRETRKGIWTTVVRMLTVATITFIAAAVWMQLGNK